jgi:hypothetical protein
MQGPAALDVLTVLQHCRATVRRLRQVRATLDRYAEHHAVGANLHTRELCSSA